MNITYIALIVFAFINTFSFFVTAHDKRKSIYGDGTDRTREGILFFLATFFGSIGVYLGMQIFRHKTSKWYFQIGIPLLILQNLATIYLVNQFIFS